MPPKEDRNNENKSPVKGPLKIGVTGGIGAGKSVVCKIFSSLGIPVFDADSRAKQLMISEPVLVSKIKASFGENAYTAGGDLNRLFLAELVFEDPEKLKLLNSLVHPVTGLEFEKWTQEQNAVPYVIKEAALIFESGSHHKLDAVIAVTAPEELRLRRTVLRDEHRTRKQVEDIISRQLPEEERIKLASYRIVNDEKNLLIPQVIRLHKIFSAGKA